MFPVGNVQQSIGTTAMWGRANIDVATKSDVRSDVKSPEPMPKINPPYLAFRTFRHFLDGLRASGIPGRIDRSVMSSLSGGAQSALIGPAGTRAR